MDVRWPAPSTVWRLSSHPPMWLRSVEGVGGAATFTGATKWLRPKPPTATRIVRNPTSVTAIAGRVRRTIAPAATPSATAKKAYAPGTRPCSSKIPGWKRSPVDVISGASHHVASAAYAPARSNVAPRTKPSLAESQRRRPTPCVHTSRCVPCSSSRAMSGAPQQTYEQRNHEENRLDPPPHREALLEAALDVAAVPVTCQTARKTRAVEDGVHVGARQEEERGQQRERGDAEESLLPMLAPDEPGHPFASAGPASMGRADKAGWPMYASTSSSRSTSCTVHAGS